MSAMKLSPNPLLSAGILNHILFCTLASVFLILSSYNYRKSHQAKALLGLNVGYFVVDLFGP